MKNILFIIVLIILSSFSVFAQTEQKSEKSSCPAISITPPPAMVRPGELQTFTANLDWKDKGATEIEYVWEVDVGKIVSGQGTPTISVSTDPSADITVNATVLIKGLPEECPNSATDAGIVCSCVENELIDEFSNIPDDDLIARLDNLFIRLNGDPNATGYIVNYGSAKNIKSREKLFKDFYKHRKYDLSRIVFVNGGKEKEIRTRLWIVPAGADPTTIN